MIKDVFDYTLPVFHPIFVHLPVALLPVAFIAGIVWVARPTHQWGFFTAGLLAVAAVGAVLAFMTGETLYAQSEGVPVVELFVDRHRQLGRLVMIAAIASFVLTVAALILDRHPDRASAGRYGRFVSLALILVSVALVLVTAHLGGIMVWGEYSG